MLSTLYEIIIKGKVYTLTVYPDAHPETNTVDGDAGRIVGNPGDTWSDIHDGAGNNSSHDADSMSVAIASGSGTDRWTTLDRSIALFDTSEIPNGALFESAVLDVYIYEILDDLGINPKLGVYSSNPLSNTTLQNADYGRVGTTLFCELLNYADVNTNQYNSLVFNQAGREAINKKGITKLSLREGVYDATDTEPVWADRKASYFHIRTADHGVNTRPKLTITYRI
jgi:hypothetical protein